MKKTVVTNFLLPASNEVISFSLMREERRLFRRNSFVRCLAMTIMNYVELLIFKRDWRKNGFEYSI